MYWRNYSKRLKCYDGYYENEEELKQIIWKDIKEMNQSLPNYKHIKNLILSNEPMIKTTTAKVKRFEEIKKETRK